MIDGLLRTALTRAGRAARIVAVAVIGGFARRLRFGDVEARVTALPVRDQALITGATLTGLFLTSLLFAQFGLVGLLAFFLLVIAVVN